MKLLLMGLSMLMVVTQQQCKKPVAANANCYKGKLVVKAACMNYIISVTEGHIDPSLVAATWTDSQKGQSFKNAFALDSRCNFPQTINEGDEFYFSIDSGSVQNCAVCLIYYPTPEKKLRIKVLPGACQ